MPRKTPQERQLVLCADGEIRNSRINTRQDSTGFALKGYVSIGLLSITGWILPSGNADELPLFEPNLELRNGHMLPSWQAVRNATDALMAGLTDKQQLLVLGGQTDLATLYGTPSRRVLRAASLAATPAADRPTGTPPQWLLEAVAEGDGGPIHSIPTDLGDIEPDTTDEDEFAMGGDDLSDVFVDTLGDSEA